MSNAYAHSSAIHHDESLEELLAREAWKDAEDRLCVEIQENLLDPTNYVVLSHVLLRQGNTDAAAQQLFNADLILGKGDVESRLKEELQAEIEAQRAVIHVEQSARALAQGASEANPYHAITDHAHWFRSVTDRPSSEIPIQHEPRFKIDMSTAIASAGSCFAQNIARWLDGNGYSYLVTEPGPENMPEDQRYTNGFGLYTARYGNIYTALQLVQLFDRAYGEFSPSELAWAHEEGFVDPYRPRVQLPPFRSVIDLLEDRERHLGTVRRMFEDCDVFIFTLGLTEAWRSKEDGAIFPICPGTTAGAFSSDKYEFVNFGVDEVGDHLEGFVERLAGVNPKAHIILTVSPVPLVATQEDRPVLQSTVYSKSVLRVAADQIRERHSNVEYFASYEMITHPYQWRANAAYSEDRRTVTDAAIEKVMVVFQTHFCAEESPVDASGNDKVTADHGINAVPNPVQPAGTDAAPHGLLPTPVVCDELDAYGDQDDRDRLALTSQIWEFYAGHTNYVFCPESVLRENGGSVPRNVTLPEGYDQKLFGSLEDWLAVIANACRDDGIFLCLGSSHTARATSWPFYLHRRRAETEHGPGNVVNMGAMGHAAKYQPSLLRQVIPQFVSRQIPVKHTMSLIGGNDIFNWYVALLSFAQGKRDNLPWTGPRNGADWLGSNPARPDLELSTRRLVSNCGEQLFPTFQPSPNWASVVANQIVGDAQRIHDEAQMLDISHSIALQPIASKLLYSRHAQIVRSAFEESGEESYSSWRMQNQINEHVGEYAAFREENASTQYIFDYDGLYMSLIEYFQILNRENENHFVDMSRCFAHLDNDRSESAYHTDAFHYTPLGSSTIAECFLDLITV